jgi:hypothetical protein
MKAMKTIFLMLSLMLAGSICADELNVADFTIQPGENKAVSVELINPNHAYNALQFQLTLPSGLSIAKTNGDKWDVAPNSERLGGFSLEVSEVGEGVYQFLIYVFGQDTFIAGNSGELFTMTLTAAANAATGLKQGLFSEQLSAGDDVEDGYEPADKAFNITVGGLLGDANGDQEVTISDVVAVVSYILNNQPGNFNFNAANVDGIGDITIEDAIGIVNIILGNDNASSSRMRTEDTGQKP